jgi:hypothetical protein
MLNVFPEQQLYYVEYGGKQNKVLGIHKNSLAVARLKQNKIEQGHSYRV